MATQSRRRSSKLLPRRYPSESSCSGKQTPEATKYSDLPREARRKHMLVARMESARLQPQKVIIRDLSPFGLSCRAVFPPELAETVTFALGPFGEVDGIVRWVRGSRFGVRLDQEIDTMSIVMAKTGFRSVDYPLPTNEKFENMMVFEFFRDGNFDKL